MRLVVLASAFCVASFASAQDLGPLEVRNLRSLSVPFLRLNPRPFVLGEGRTDWSLAFEAANDIRLQTQGGRTVREDYEIDRLVLRYRVGLGNGNDLTVEASALSRGGGFLDGLIDFWHRYVLQLKSNIRDGVPYGQSYVDIPGHQRYGSATGIGDISIGLTRQVNPRLMGTVAVKLPTGDSRKLLGSGAVDFGGALQWHVPMNRRWDFHMQAGYIIQGRGKELTESRKDALQGALTLTYKHNSRDTYIGQWQAEPSAIKTGVQGSDTSHRMVSLGYRRKLNENRFLELYLLEDGDWLNYRLPEFANIAPDLTLGAKYVVRF